VFAPVVGLAVVTLGNRGAWRGAAATFQSRVILMLIELVPNL